MNAYQCTDGVEEPSLDDSLIHLAKEIIKQAGIPDAKWEPIESDTVGSKITMKHPGPIINAKEMTVKDKQSHDVGSGVFARTFVQAEVLVMTTRGFSPISEVHRRIIWSL